uniref:Uncharacterized protein n=1 Tax=Rhizophora mucronata TaxID=61149 RepID=A0A2P2MLW2_RHIMU
MFSCTYKRTFQCMRFLCFEL